MGFGKSEADSENKLRQTEITHGKLCIANTEKDRNVRLRYSSKRNNKNAHTKCKIKLMNYVGVSIELFSMLNIQKQQAPR